MKAVIIEDEHLIAKELAIRIKNIAPDIEIVETLPSMKTALKWFMENAEPDILFMDIQLSDGVSFELFDRYEIKCPVIFTTAYDEYAIRAFKVNGVDYLLKPVDEEELQKAISKCRTIIESRSNYPMPMQRLLQSLMTNNSGISQYKEKFIVNVRHQWIPINTKDRAGFLRDNLN
jgi:DNA-binding LytR/AlgR family response regulator